MPTFANLPGTSVEITDQGLRITRAPSGPKVVLLGFTTSANENAEPYVPFLVSNTSLTSAYSSVKNADGTASELSKALFEAHVAGARNIETMNILPSASGAYLSDDDRYGYLEKAYEVLYNYNADIIVPVGAKLDSRTLSGHRSFGYQLANFCYRATKNNNTCMGVIGVVGATTSPSGTPTLGEIEEWVVDLENYTYCPQYDGTTDANDDGKPENYAFVATTSGDMPFAFSGGDILDAKGNRVDIGSYLSVVATNLRAINEAVVDVYPKLGYYNTDGAAAYAGLISSLPSKSAPTNKVIQGVILQQGISLSQADRLAGKRFITVLDKPKGYVVSSAMTGAYNISEYFRSDFVRLTTVRIMQDAINIIRTVSEQFIGEPNSAPQRNALSTAVENALAAMQEAGALRRFDFNIFATPADQVLGKATIELILVPAFELQQITVYVSLASE
jgi:hypothetical protein